MELEAQNIKKTVDVLYRHLQKVLHFSHESKNVDFYISALTEYNPFYSTDEIVRWLSSLNTRQYFTVEQILLRSIQKWRFHPGTGDLEHESGGFFSIRGLKVKTNVGSIPRWSQPIICQPEIGLLGIIAKKINGILYFLLQAKAEPGNINTYQLSPTVQATRSNYTKLHGGKSTLYLEHFLGGRRGAVLIDQLQSEQGARFLCKRNRNMIIRLGDDEVITVQPYHRWLTLGQIQTLIQRDNIVNMDTRSVISHINFAPERVTTFETINPTALREALESSPIVTKLINEFAISLAVSSHPSSPALHTTEEILQKITQAKCNVTIERRLIPLSEVEGWIQTTDEIAHAGQKYFSIIGVRVYALDREIPSWDQPIVKQRHPGIVAFIAKEINGVLHFLVQLKMEGGLMDILEIAPTVQCIPENYNAHTLPRYTEKFLGRGKDATIVDVYQSEEGGRFYQESNRNIVMVADQNFSDAEPPFFFWASLQQLKELIKFNNLINVETRSLLSCLKMT